MIQTFSGQEHVEQLLGGSVPAWILKHSNTCPTSAAALDEVEAYLTAHPGEPAGMVVVQTDRPLSNWIATRLARVHQSPQLFLVHRGQVVWAVSHWSITAAAMATERARLG
jgi:bacillithiol system protein YtxJ